MVSTSEGIVGAEVILASQHNNPVAELADVVVDHPRVVRVDAELQVVHPVGYDSFVRGSLVHRLPGPDRRGGACARRRSRRRGRSRGGGRGDDRGGRVGGLRPPVVGAPRQPGRIGASGAGRQPANHSDHQRRGSCGPAVVRQRRHGPLGVAGRSGMRRRDGRRAHRGHRARRAAAVDIASRRAGCAGALGDPAGRGDHLRRGRPCRLPVVGPAGSYTGRLLRPRAWVDDVDLRVRHGRARRVRSVRCH